MTLVTMSVGKRQSGRIWGVQILSLTGRGGMHVAVSLFGCFPFSVVTILAQATWGKGGSRGSQLQGVAWPGGSAWWQESGVTAPSEEHGLHLHGHRVFCIGLVVLIPVSVQIRIIAMSWFWAWLYVLLHGTKYSNSHRVIQFGSFIEVARLLLGKTKAL